MNKKPNVCKNCDKKDKCFFEKNNLVCKKLFKYINDNKWI